MTARAGLLEEDADAAVDVRVGRALAVVEVVELLLAVVQPPLCVESARVIRSDEVCQLDVALGGARIAPARHAGLEEEGRVRAHLVVVGEHVGLPEMVAAQTRL